MAAEGGKKKKKLRSTTDAASIGSEAAAGAQGDGRRGIVGAGVDALSVFIRGLPKGTTDAELRAWLVNSVAPTKEAYRIRDDYGIAKFNNPEDARRCIEKLSGTDFGGSVVRFEAAKPKRPTPAGRGAKRALPSDAAGSAPAEAGASAAEVGPDMRTVQLSNLPTDVKKEKLRSWVEELLPGGCGIENLRRITSESGEGGVAPKGAVFAVSFRKERNALRALEALQGEYFGGKAVAAGLRAVELSRESTKAGRIIVRNLAFGATEKHVRKAFEKLGSLADVHLPLKPGATQHRGFAFVQFAERPAAEKAIVELNGAKICGRGVAVDWAVESNLYANLQREEVQQQKRQKRGDEGTDQGKKQKASPDDVDESEADDEEEESEEEEDSDAELASKTRRNKTGGDEDAEHERERMKRLLGEGEGGGQKQKEQEKVKKKTDIKSSQDHEDDEDEDEESEEEGKSSKEKSKDKDTRKPGFDVTEERSIFVRNVPFEAGEEQLRGCFKRFGQIAHVKFVADRSGENAHRGSAFVKFRDAAGAAAALAAEAEAERKLRELSTVTKKSDQRELPAMEGFGIALQGRRLVVCKAVAPDEVGRMQDERKPEKGSASKEKKEWMHLLNVGRIDENSPEWEKLSKPEKNQRLSSIKERKFRANNPNFTIDPRRLSVRNLPRWVDAAKLQEAIVGHLATASPDADADADGAAAIGRKARRRAAQAAVIKVGLVRDNERRDFETNMRRSKGFGFVAFADNKFAMRALEFMNDNPEVFGGGRRPIVEFAIEDKRKLRMQQELYQKHAWKLQAQPGDDKGVNKPGQAAQTDQDPKAKQWGKRLKKAEQRKEKGFSRGRLQREKKRAKKAAEETKAVTRTAGEAESDRRNAAKREEAVAERAARNSVAGSAAKRKPALQPDAAAQKGAKKARESPGISDDFELRAMERFRTGSRKIPSLQG